MIARRVYRPRPNMPVGSGAKGNAVYIRLDYSQRWDRPAHGQISAILPETGQGTRSEGFQGNRSERFQGSEVSPEVSTRTDASEREPT